MNPIVKQMVKVGGVVLFLVLCAVLLRFYLYTVEFTDDPGLRYRFPRGFMRYTFYLLFFTVLSARSLYLARKDDLITFLFRSCLPMLPIVVWLVLTFFFDIEQPGIYRRLDLILEVTALISLLVVGTVLYWGDFVRKLAAEPHQKKRFKKL